MKKTYTFKQILFGLRKEYLEIEKQLNNLKKYVIYNDNVDECKFYLTSGVPSYVVLHLIKKRNLLNKLTIKLGLDSYLNYQHNYNVTSDIKRTYQISKKGICIVYERNKLKEDISKITESKFAKNIVANNFSPISCDENKYNGLAINTAGINLTNSLNEIYPLFHYNPENDEISIENKTDIITSTEIDKIMNLTLNSNKLNNYHCGVIDGFEDKDIIIEDNFDSNKVNLKIIEEHKKLILKPININK